MLRKKPSKTLPRMLAVRASRESCLAFYNEFRRFNIDYVAASEKKFTPTIGEISEHLKIINSRFYPVFGFDPVGFIQKKVSNLSWVNIEGLEELVKKSDLVNLTDTYYFFNRQAALLAEKYKKPVVTVVWTTIPNHPSTWLPPYSFNVKQVLKVTDLFILRCKSAYKFTDSLAIDRNKIKMIYKGVDLKHFYPAKTVNKEQVNILYVGNFHKSKGLLDLLVVFEKLVSEGLPVRLLLAGRGQLTDLVNEKTQTLPLKNYGFVRYKDLGNVYRKGDIFCSPSKEMRWFGLKIWEEYFSYTLMEAQASGLPIITTKTGGIPEEVGDRNLLIEPEDREALYRQLKKLVLDKKKRAYLGNMNRKRAERLFDAEKQAKRTEDAIQKIL